MQNALNGGGVRGGSFTVNDPTLTLAGAEIPCVESDIGTRPPVERGGHAIRRGAAAQKKQNTERQGGSQKQTRSHFSIPLCKIKLAGKILGLCHSASSGTSGI